MRQQTLVVALHCVNIVILYKPLKMKTLISKTLITRVNTVSFMYLYSAFFSPIHRVHYINYIVVSDIKEKLL